MRKTGRIHLERDAFLLPFVPVGDGEADDKADGGVHRAMTKHHWCPKHGREVCPQPKGVPLPQRRYHSCSAGERFGNFTKMGKPIKLPRMKV